MALTEHAAIPVRPPRTAARRPEKSGTRRRLERFLGDAVVRAALVIFVLWTLAPIGWMIVSSLLNQVALTSVPPISRPRSSPSTTIGACWRPAGVSFPHSATRCSSRC